MAAGNGDDIARTPRTPGTPGTTNTTPTGLKFRAAPISGYFLEHDDHTGQPGYIGGMHDAFALHNCTGGVPPSCIAALPPDEQWNCIFANYSYAHR